MSTEKTDQGEIVVQPIFKGQKTNDPYEIAQLASEGAEYDSSFLLSRGGSWMDPFTGQQIGMALDWSGVDEMKTLNPDGTFSRSPNAPSDLFDDKGKRIGDPMVTANIKTPAEGIDPADLLDIAGRVAITTTFQPHRVDMVNKYGEFFHEEVGENILGGSISKLDTLRHTTTGHDILTGTVPSYYGDDYFFDETSQAMATLQGNQMSLAAMESNLEVYGSLTGNYGPQGMSGIQNTTTYNSMNSGVNPSGFTSQEDTASSILRDVLIDYGLEDLLEGDFNILDAWIETNDINAVWAQVRQTPTYQKRFPGMSALAAQGRAISEEQYVSLEQGYAKVLASFGLPKSFYDSADDFGEWIAGDVSTTELSQRVALADQAAVATTQEVKDALDVNYGIKQSDLTAYYLDPQRATSVFEERFRLESAGIIGAAEQTGFGSVNRQTAERLVRSGVSEREARRGFGELAATTIGEETASEKTDITDSQLIDAKFGMDDNATKQLETRRQKRLADFSGTSSTISSQAGYKGLGSTS